MRNRVLTLAAAAAVLLGATASASAQGTGTTTEPTFELSAGYQLLRQGEVCDDESPLEETCAPDRTFPFGLTVDAIRNFGALGILAEGGWAFDSETITDDAGEVSEEIDFKFNTWHVGAGVRYTSRKKARLWPYGQVIAGIVHDRASVDGVDDDFSQTSFMLQPGVGATYIAGDGWGFFGQIDYRRVFLDENENLASGRNDLRFVFGLRMILD